MSTTITIVEDITQVSVSAVNPTASFTASGLGFIPHNTITGTNIQDALEQMADQYFRGNEVPSASTANLEEGDFFYDLNDNQLKVYRETSNGVFQFVALAQATGDMETVDAGSF
jgi:hypothetical protein|tara:strand:- start:5023 stop:5364 length:342 start_codon:yes stop_codon:yes gene_type:complete